MQVTNELEENIDDNNPILEWMSEMCEVTHDNNDRILFANLLSAYQQATEQECTAKTFSKEMRKLGYVTTKSNSNTYYFGMRFLEESALHYYTEDDNPVGSWLKDFYNITTDPQHRIRTCDMYAQFCYDTRHKLSNRAFAKEMAFNGHPYKKTNGEIVYVGFERNIQSAF